LPGLNATGYASYLRPALSRIAQHCPDVRQGFLAPATCLEIRNAMNQGVAEPAEVFDTGATLDVSTRRATSIDIDPVTLDVVEAMLDRARPAIGVACQTPVEGREGPAFLRYEPGGFYRRHRDRASDAEWPGAARRLISVVVFLNSSSSEPTPGEFGGGELLIFPEPPGGVGTTEPMVIVPQQGTLVAFHASMLHEVRPVRRGTRDVIVDWYC
jgi:predicted 2-oxoglutarate/Fe(II)-dependent dioxygenase YbiX